MRKVIKSWFILITLGIIFSAGGVIYAINNTSEGFRINNNGVVKITAYGYSIENKSGKAYFIPTKTQAESDALKAKASSLGLTICNVNYQDACSYSSNCTTNTGTYKCDGNCTVSQPADTTLTNCSACNNCNTCDTKTATCVTPTPTCTKPADITLTNCSACNNCNTCDSKTATCATPTPTCTKPADVTLTNCSKCNNCGTCDSKTATCATPNPTCTAPADVTLTNCSACNNCGECNTTTATCATPNPTCTAPADKTWNASCQTCSSGIISNVAAGTSCGTNMECNGSGSCVSSGYSHTDGYGHFWISQSLPKSKEAAMEACQHYYPEHAGMCAYISPNCASATNRYTSLAMNCPNPYCDTTGYTYCDVAVQISHINARDYYIWFYQVDGFCGWYVGGTGNAYNYCTAPVVNWY